MASRRALARVLASAVVLGTLAGTLLVPAVVIAQELRLDPIHGQATDPFNASFVEPFSEPKFCGQAGTAVAFIWWGSDNESSALLGIRQLNPQCRAGITAVPPEGLNDEGPHQITAFTTCDTYPNCDFIAQGQATATYTIDPLATPSPSPSPSPTPSPTPTPTRKPTASPTPFVAPPPAPTPTPAPTESPSPSPSPSPGPTPSAVPTAGPTPTATLVAIASPGPTGPPPTSTPGSGAVGGGGGGPGVWGRSAFVSFTPDAGQFALDLDIEVVTTNLLLTLLLLLIFGTTSALFNSTLESNKETIDGWIATWRGRLGRIAGPFAAAGAWVVGPLRRGRQAPRLRIALILLLTGLVYGFLSPDFGLNAQSAILFISLAIGLGAVTYINEGGAAIFASNQLHVPAGVRVHAAALVVAVLCVGASRVIDFKPGIVYGFVASTAFLVPAALDRRQNGKVALYPAIALLMVSLSAWALLGVVRGIESGSDGWALPLSEAILAVIFVGGLEGVFYNMIPLTFMDGRAVADWSKIAWAVMFGLATFLFFQLLINPDQGYLDALRETKVVLVVSLVVFYVVITLGTWSYFRWRAGREAAAAG